MTEENLARLVKLVNEEMLETSSRHEKELEQTEKQLAQVSGKLTKLYMALESGQLELNDLAPRIKELRICQNELHSRRDMLTARIEAREPETLDSREILNYANELKEVLGESSFMQRKTLLRSFIKRIEVGSDKVAVDYTLPLPPQKEGASAREVLCINKNGSGGWI